MNHLIIGNGVMGKRYAGILRSFDDLVSCVDIDWDGVIPDKMDSILICTPPETHLEVLNRVLGSKIPVFIEKPILCGNESESLCNSVLERSTGLIKTLVSCPWGFCGCIKFLPQKVFNLGYTSKDKEPYLDLIHFIDLFDI